MMKFTSRNAAIFLFSVVILSGLGACKKDDPQSKSRTELITQSAWKLVKGESRTGAAGTWVDYTSTYSACEKDDNLVLNTSGSYELNEGATKCSPADPQIYETGTWAFQSNETEIKTTPTGSSTSDVSTIETLSESTLIVTSSYTTGGTTYYDRSTFGH
jgi:hypothetical protein